MDVLGLVLAIPAVFFANACYVLATRFWLARLSRLRPALVWTSRLFVLALALDVVLAVTVGAVAARTMLGPAYWTAHLLVVVFAAPAVANLLLLGRRGFWFRHWYAAIAVCFVLGVFLVFFQVGVGAALYGPDGTGGPFSGTIGAEQRAAQSKCRYEPATIRLTGADGELPMSRRTVLLSWSSGKDSAWAIQVLRQDPDTDIVGLLTTVNTTHGRVAMHSTRRAVLEAQAQAVGVRLHVIPLPWPCSNDLYERTMRAATESAVESGVTHIAFGDLFLEDIRAYRTRQLEGSGLEPLFPIWHQPTEPLARRMIDAGVEAVITCVDPKKLPRSFAGRRFDHAFLNDLPEGVDPCGENGEFHTCVLAGPMFRQPIPAVVGETVERDGFCFADVVLIAT